ncbi:hypothetical protein [Puia dinghuensis]|uniref:hypothetical protein n=1 Tax=Puia dinghuensis TaxID=1792502 RepID=UPI00166693D3|nr:hypothetical protein [Puia dinghuensis]
MLRILARVAFICNICFLVVSFSQWLPQFPDNALTSDVIVLGWMGSLVFNVIVNLILLMLFFIGRLRKTGVPVWLLVINFLFFGIQIALLILNRNLR